MADVEGVQIPAWDLSDRMRKSLRHAEIGVQEIADYLGVSRTAVSSWINGRNRPNRPTLMLWAQRCGVSLDWLIRGRMETNVFSYYLAYAA